LPGALLLPAFRFDAADAAAVTAYLKSLAR
jgi:hypothetical protein